MLMPRDLCVPSLERCLDRMIFFGERTLWNALNEFVEFYHHERNHPGLGHRLIARAAGWSRLRRRLKNSAPPQVSSRAESARAAGWNGLRRRWGASILLPQSCVTRADTNPSSARLCPSAHRMPNLHWKYTELPRGTAFPGMARSAIRYLDTTRSRRY